MIALLVIGVLLLFLLTSAAERRAARVRARRANTGIAFAALLAIGLLIFR